jgi:hypothetical protein
MEILKTGACPDKIDTYKHLKRSIRILLCSPNPTKRVVLIFNHKDKQLKRFIHDIVAVN